MRFWLQYHNYDKLGYLPGGYDTDAIELSALDTSRYAPSCITTRKRIIRDAVGDVVFFIVGYGAKSKRYVLWSWCLVEHVEGENERFDAYGTGRVLIPPPLLAGPDFDEFKRSNANFSLGFRDISNVSFLDRIMALAREWGDFATVDSYARALNSIPEEVRGSAKLVEGALHVITVNAYERNPEARRQCLEHYGHRCFICGFEFGAEYGPAAERIIHVHHLQPLSEIEDEYEVNPIADLRPVCPNCHAVIHARTPPYSIEDVQAFLEQHRAGPKAAADADRDSAFS